MRTWIFGWMIIALNDTGPLKLLIQPIIVNIPRVVCHDMSNVYYIAISKKGFISYRA